MSHASPYYCNSIKLNKLILEQHIYRAGSRAQEKLTDENKTDYVIIC